MYKQWWLGSIKVIYTSSIGYEAKVFELIHEVLQRRVYNVEELGFDEAFDYEVAVPVICVTESENPPEKVGRNENNQLRIYG